MSDYTFSASAGETTMEKFIRIVPRFRVVESTYVEESLLLVSPEVFYKMIKAGLLPTPKEESEK